MERLSRMRGGGPPGSIEEESKRGFIATVQWWDQVAATKLHVERTLRKSKIPAAAAAAGNDASRAILRRPRLVCAAASKRQPEINIITLGKKLGNCKGGSSRSTGA